ncbi:YifB family Mg chelatase-like AAA ATPase [Syntrophomonas palmitatica]|uniref:YifB family Mg chelatase-like AAA ATPase n=1 Tax=Syntrophomonas palmitatica TaxID=402877 RepID=UPI000AC875BD
MAANNLQEVCRYLENNAELLKVSKKDNDIISPNNLPDFADVKGQETAKRGMQIAAAGSHNILLIGPPGGGKTMLARRMPGIMPDMTREEVLETTRIYSVAGLLNPDHPLIENRPFRAPHKNASAASIIGGGRIPRPGEITLAQNGVLFLDEFPEFSRDVLEALRQPLEDKVVTVARAQATHTYPADFALIGSMNPCPCGFFGSDLECACTPLQIQKYLSRISGPLLDRMDLHVEVPRVNYEQLRDRGNGESSAAIREKVIRARDIQKKRFSRHKIRLNSQMRPADVKKYCRLDEESEFLLKNAFDKLKMSARAYDRILKVSRTIADLEGCENIKVHHLAEALQYRSLDRKYWRQA